MTAAAFVWSRAQAVTPKRKPRERVLRPVKPLPAEAVAYARAMRLLFAEVRTATEASLLPYLERRDLQALDSAVEDRLSEELRAILAILRRNLLSIVPDRARSMSRAVLNAISKRHRDRFYASAKEAMGIDLSEVVSENRIGPLLRLTTEQNVALITSIPEQYLAKVEAAVYRHVIHGQRGSKPLAKQIQEIGDVSAKRAKFIARDQTAKLVSALNRERSLAIGIESYVWRTSKDERVRPTHRANEGKTFRWDDPPAKTGHPGTEPNCRCTGSPKLKL